MLGTGVFHYYLHRSFKWLLFVSADGENEGIREIEKALRSPFPYSFAAKNTLCWILIEQKQFGRADSVALSALNEASENTIFLRIRCLIALWSGRYDQALMLAQKLSEVSLIRDPVNWSDYVMSYYVLTGSYDGLGKVKEALAAADHILGVKIPPEFQRISPIKKNLKRILAIKEKY
jgi:tetratricopeptide (TPR) repeat protein